MSQATFNQERIAELLDTCCSQVLETMFFSPVFEILPPDSGIGAERVCARVRFHGKSSGCFDVDLDADTCLMMTAAFMGVDESEVTPEQMDDCLAEFANMACGSVLSSLGEVEYFHLDTPTVSHTPEFEPALPHSRRAFALERGSLSVAIDMD
jgi:hypothetical protein